MNILVIDVGGTHVKVLMRGQSKPVKIESGDQMTSRQMVEAVLAATSTWDYDVISLGVPAPVIRHRVLREPYNLGHGWVGFDFAEAFGKPVKLVNDALMQALGSYSGGRMLFLGLGTGLGTAVIDDGHQFPLEIAHLSYRKSTYEAYASDASRKQVGRKKWQRRVHRMADELRDALLCDTVVLGGGNAKRLKSLPEHAVRGDNANAFEGGFRLWSGKDASAGP